MKAKQILEGLQRITEGADMYCKHCGENLGKMIEVEGNQGDGTGHKRGENIKVHCSTCGEKTEHRCQYDTKEKNEANNEMSMDEFKKEFKEYASDNEMGSKVQDADSNNWDYMFDMYKKDATFHEILQYLKDPNEFVKGDVNEAAKQMASSSDKAKFKGLKSQIEKLEADKEKIRDDIKKAHESGNTKNVESLQEKRTQILDKIKKLEDEKRKMMNKFRQLR